MDTITHAQMIVVIQQGGTILWHGRTLYRVEDLPTDEQIAAEAAAVQPTDITAVAPIVEVDSTPGDPDSMPAVTNVGTPRAARLRFRLPRGAKSLYQLWLDAGNVGTFADFTATLQGPKGDAGAAGATGPTGPAGAKGDKGDAGTTGPQGATGTAGPVGAAGATGTAGPVGAAGATGVAGPTGPKGDQGATGSQGSAGTTGAAGAVGLTGAKGDKGDTGATGAGGPTGATGAQGQQGFNAHIPYSWVGLLAAVGPYYYTAPEAMTIGSAAKNPSNAPITYSKALAASPLSFSTVSLPVSLAVGDVLKIECGSLLSLVYASVTLKRTA